MSGRTMFIFARYVYGYVDLAYHSLLVACFLWGLIGVKFIIFLAHALRSIAVTFAIGESRNRLSDVEKILEIFAYRCAKPLKCTAN